MRDIDQFDWLIGKGATDSRFTGPDSDHTRLNAPGGLNQQGEIDNIL